MTARGDEFFQGKCAPCGVRFFWPRRPLRVKVSEATCPYCGRHLARTTQRASTLRSVGIDDPRKLPLATGEGAPNGRN